MSKILSRVSVPHIRALKGDRKIVAITAYDYTQATIIDCTNIDLVLVGDSLGCIVQGHESTIPVTLEQMIYHSRCVSRGISRALVVGDLPFMTYQISVEQALQSASRLIQDGGVAAIKLEGGVNVSDKIAAISKCDIPVMGHVGLTPQSFHRMGGHKIQGRESATDKKMSGSRQQVIEDAIAVEEAGAFAVVLEGIPAELAAEISSQISIPTIGIGAGSACDGQILVISDLLGMTERSPRFARRYLELREDIANSLNQYASDVHTGNFPSLEESFISPTLKAVPIGGA